MTVEDILIQLPNFLGMGVAILVLIRQLNIVQEINQKLTDVIVTKQNCANIDSSPPSDKQYIPSGVSRPDASTGRSEVDWRDKTPT